MTVRASEHGRSRSAAPPRRFAAACGLAAAAALAVAAPARSQVWLDQRVESVRPQLPTSSELVRVMIDPSFLRLVEELDSDDYARREAAMERLLGDWNDPLQALAVLERQVLSCEQRHRLLQVARAQIVGRPRGAIGISMQGLDPARAGGSIEVVVTDLLPGLPAVEVLQLGDRIVEVDGQPIFNRDEILTHVQNKTPGERVLLSLRRQVRDDGGQLVRDAQERPVYENIEVELTLGSADRLVNPGTGEAPNPSPVVQQRARDAEAAVDRYSRSHQVSITGTLADPSVPVEMGWRPGDEVGALTPLKRLIAELERAPDGFIIQRDMREQWALSMRWLQEQMRRGDLSAEEQRDVKRAIELVTQRLRDG